MLGLGDWLVVDMRAIFLCTLSMQTLLDLGASPDYKDSRGLSPLYHSSMVGGDPYCCELLLHDHAHVGCMDENGWQEIHQVLLSQRSCFQLHGTLVQTHHCAMAPLIHTFIPHVM